MWCNSWLTWFLDKCKITWQRKCYWTLIPLYLTDDVITAHSPYRGDPSPGCCSRSEPRASDNWKGFCWVAAPETIIIRVLPLLDYSREYNIYCTHSPRLAQAPQSDSNCGRRTNVLVIIKIILCKCLPGNWLIFIIELLSSFNIRRGFSHQRFHSDALISFDSESDLCLGSSLPIWILMLSHHLDYH